MTREQSLYFLSIVAFLLFISLVLRVLSVNSRGRLSSTVGALVQLLLSTGLVALITYVTVYFLALLGGFYESLTCKVVTLPSCEDPLGLPSWLRLPAQSVGGVIGILPLLGIYLAKLLQGDTKPLEPLELPWWQSLLRRSVHWLTNNMSIVFVFAVELWLAFLRGSAEAADRQVRLSLGLDADLPAIYLSVAQWGAVVLALGLSLVVVYMGVIGKYGRKLMGKAFIRLEYGAALVSVASAVLGAILSVFTDLWKAVAIATGRIALKLQSGVQRIWLLLASTTGRLALKLQSFLYRSWVFLAVAIGRPFEVAWYVLKYMVSGRRRDVERSLKSLLFLGLVLSFGVTEAKTFVVLFDATGSEASRIEEMKQKLLSWADPSPERAILERGDRLILIPIVAPGNLDRNYSAVFNALYPSSQLERYSFFTDLRDSVPSEVDTDNGTGLSDSLRAASFYLEDAEDERVLMLFGNGEDHSASPVTASELTDSLQDTSIIHLNIGLESRDYWRTLFERAGASNIQMFDLAATRSLSVTELEDALGR